MNDIKEALTKDLQIAMRQKDFVTVNAIRTLRGRIDNAEAPLIPKSKPMQISGGIAGASSDSRETEVSRKELSIKDIQEIIQDEINDIERMLAILRDSSMEDTEHLAEQIVVLKKYL
ncbi:MAG: hypothetical protein ABIO57_01675 [Candidatus Paceibacterota bacterium]